MSNTAYLRMENDEEFLARLNEKNRPRVGYILYPANTEPPPRGIYPYIWASKKDIEELAERYGLVRKLVLVEPLKRVAR